jgi:YidC/Oxa1 family membrane protein insertase
MIELFNLLIVAPITNLLLAIYQVVNATQLPYGLGISVILLTIAMRFLLAPLTASQLKAAKKMQEVAPELKKLKEKYKGNAQRLQAETMLLYKQQGINPAAGCLPVILQLPIIWGLYNVLQHLVKETSLSEINKYAYADWLKLNTLWDTTFLGIPIAQTPSNLFSTIGVVIILVPLLTGLSQFVQSRMMIPATKPEETKPVKSSKKKKSIETKTQPDFATAFQTQTLYIFPLMIGFFSFTFPVGLSLYWITFTIFGIIQQYKLQGPGGLAPLLETIKGKYNGRTK